MQQADHHHPTLSRRRFLVSTAAVGAAAVAGGFPAPARANATYRRKNVVDIGAAKDLEAYQEAVWAMLALPPDDPRNWYRLAMVHLIDCPHGNWWFFPWHRGFIGWFERICRDLSGKADFALPYWDWTALPRIPDVMFDTILDPTNPGFLDDNAELNSRFRAPVQQFWNGLTSEQQTYMNRRGFTQFNQMWTEIMQNFPPRKRGRTLTRTHPALPTPGNVTLSRVDGGLAMHRYVALGTAGFSSSPATTHTRFVDSAIIEGYPHNGVHNDIGGYMPTLMSPVDPIFYLHHCNIDRLWDVWTQVNDDRPRGSDFTGEKFLYFVDAAGAAVTQVDAGSYMDIGGFDYDYQPGSGTAAPPVVAAAGGGRAAATAQGSARYSLSEVATIDVPLAGPAAGERRAPDFSFARVTFVPPVHAEGLRFNVYVAAAGTRPDLDPEGPNYAGSYTLFGHGAAEHAAHPITFTVPLREVLENLAASGAVTADTPALAVSLLADTIHVGAERGDEAAGGTLEAVTLGDF